MRPGQGARDIYGPCGISHPTVESLAGPAVPGGVHHISEPWFHIMFLEPAARGWWSSMITRYFREVSMRLSGKAGSWGSRRIPKVLESWLLQ